MADIESNIDLNINASGALATLKELQRQISVFQTTMAKTGGVSSSRLSEMQRNLVNNINSTGQFTASIQKVKTTTESFTQALEKNKLSMGQYFRYSLGATKTFGKGFKTEFDTIEKVARERVKTLQTQYIKLGRDASGAMQAIAVRPQVLDMKDLGTQTAIAAQKAQLFNQLMAQGSTQLLNFGKNTQWAGRQLMVGFTIPLGIMGAAAAKEFQAIEEQVIRLQRVYGDFTTTMADTEQITQQIKDLGGEFTKYGVAVSKTIGLAADAAAMGKTGADLVAQVAEANRLAVLGGVDQQQSLETTISLTNSFGIAADQLSSKINFLNAVENQTVTSIEDLTDAIPKAGPVVQQLGGNVEDLTFFLTAMKEGGINASEGANALKSGLASLINPTQEASDMLAGFGINLQGIVQSNAGNVRGIVVEFAKALDTLDPLNRAQAIEQLFGKFQFSRLSTLFQNVIAEGSQASRVLDLTKASAAELASLSERELGRIEASPLFKYQAAIEQFKAAIAPIGEEFMKAVTPLINFGTQILEGFNSWSDGAKQFAIIAVGAVGAIGPILLMTFGLLANGIANLVKGFLFVRNGFRGLGTQSNILTEQLNYMNTEQLQAASVSASLNQVHNSLIQTFTAEADTVRNLAGAYGAAVAQQNALMGPILTSGGGTRKTGKAPRKFANGISIVPGSGNQDSQPAMLMPGEAVIPKQMVARYGPLISAMVDGKIPGYAKGTAPKKYNAQAAGIRMTVPEHLESLYGKAAAEAELARATAAATETEKALLAMRERGIKVTDQQINAATQLDRSHLIEVTNEQKKDKRAWGKDAWSVQTGGENNLILSTLNKSAKNREIYFEYLKKTGATEKQIAEIQSKITKGIALTEKELQIQGKALRSIGADWEAGKIKKGAMSPTFGMYAQAVGAGQLAREEVLASQTPAQRRASQRTPAQIQAAQALVGATQEETKETKKKTKAIKEETKKVEEKVKDPKRVAAGLKAAETRRANAAAALAAQEEQQVKQSRMQRLRGSVSFGKIGGAGMLASMALGGASMFGGPVGDIAGQVSGPLMAISGAASVLGMIPGPAGLVVAGLGALTAVAISLKQSMDQASTKAIEFQNAIGSGTKSMEKFASFTGNTTASQQMDQQRAAALQNLADQKVKDPTFGSQYLESEAGKSMMTTITEELKTKRLGDIRKEIEQQMATGIVSGALSPEQARSIVAALGETLKDPSFALSVNGKLIELFGPNGENLEDGSYEVSLKIQEQSLTSLKTTFSSVSEGLKMSGWNPWENMEKLGQAAGTMAASGANVLQQQQQLLDALDLEYQKRIEIAAANGDDAKVAELQSKQEEQKLELLKKQKGTLDAIVKPYKEITDKYNNSSNLMMDYSINDQQKLGAMGEAVDKQIALTYQGDATQAALAEQAKNAIVNAEGLGQSQEYEMKFLLSTGDIPPQTFVTLMDTFGKDSKVMNAALELTSNLGTAEGGQMIQVMNSFVNPDGTPKEDVQRNFLAMFDNKNQEEQMALSEFIDQVTAIGGNMELFVEMSVENPDQFTKVQNDFALIEAEAAKGPINLQSILSQMTSIDQAGIEAIVANQEWFDSLPEEQQKIYLTRYLTTHEEVTPGQALRYLQEKGIAMANHGDMRETGMGANRTPQSSYSSAQIEWATAQIAAESAKQYTVDNTPDTNTAPAYTPPASGGGGGGGGGSNQPEKPPTSFLDDVVKKLRQVNAGAMMLTDNFENSWAAIKGLFGGGGLGNAFNGIEQQMRKLGASEDLISLITGMSAEEYEKYKNEMFNFDATGNITGFKTMLGTIGKALRNIALGEFQNKQAATVQTTKDQFAAVQKLVAAGASYADAYEVVADAATASAIANEDNAASIKAVADAARDAAEAATSLSNAQSLVASSKKTKDMKDLVGYLQQYSSNISEAQMNAILADENLQSSLLAMFQGKAFDPASISQALTDAANKAQLELSVKKLTIPGMEEIFSDGMNKALERVSLEENRLKVKFEIDNKADQQIVKNAQQQIDDIRNRAGGIDDLEADLQRIADKEKVVNDKYDERYKALDKIDAANQRIANRQQAQLNIAQALSSGDIGAAAAAMQQLQADEASAALADRRAALQRAQELELSQITGAMGLSRKDIEEKLVELKKEIFNIEEDTLEPAQQRLEIAQRELDAELEIQDAIRKSWEARRAEIDAAKTSAQAYTDAIRESLAIQGALGGAYTAGEGAGAGLVAGFTTTTTTKAPTTTTKAPTTTANPTPTHDDAWINEMARRMYRGEFGNGASVRIAALNREGGYGYEYDRIQAAVNRNYYGYAKGGLVANYLAKGGMPKFMIGKGTDTVPAMLTPGEFVVKKYAVDKFGADNLNAINNGKYDGGSVYNSNTYSINVNVKSDANANDIARTVMAQIKNIDNQRIRGNRF